VSGVQEPPHGASVVRVVTIVSARRENPADASVECALTVCFLGLGECHGVQDVQTRVPVGCVVAVGAHVLHEILHWHLDWNNHIGLLRLDV
jgi:hypothetical protein